MLFQTKDAPLLNRAAQGTYPPGTSVAAFTPSVRPPNQPSADDLQALYRRLGFFTAPDLRMPVAIASTSSDLQSLRISPLQMAIASSVLSNGGIRPAPRIALAVKTPVQGWVILAPLGGQSRAMSETEADDAATRLAVQSGTYWQWIGQARAGEQIDTWFLAGTLPNWRATPLALAVLIEGNDLLSAQQIGQQLIQSATRP